MRLALKLPVAEWIKAEPTLTDDEMLERILAQADAIMGPDWATPSTFRFGASGLLAGVLIVHLWPFSRPGVPRWIHSANDQASAAAA